MDLGEHGDVTVLQTFDGPALPQRPVAIEMDLHQVTGELGELLGAARLRYGDVAQVVVEVEVGVFDPQRMVQPHRDLGETAPEGCREVKT